MCVCVYVHICEKGVRRAKGALVGLSRLLESRKLLLTSYFLLSNLEKLAMLCAKVLDCIMALFGGWTSVTVRSEIRLEKDNMPPL